MYGRSAPLGVRLIRRFAQSKWFTESRKIELYPPFWFMRVRVTELVRFGIRIGT